MIKRILAEAGEEDCEVDVEILHETLLKLPAEKYFELYKKIYAKIYGYPPFLGFSSGCCGTIGEKEDDNAKYYDKTPKISKSYSVGETDTRK